MESDIHAYCDTCPECDRTKRTWVVALSLVGIVRNIDVQNIDVQHTTEDLSGNEPGEMASQACQRIVRGSFVGQKVTRMLYIVATWQVLR